MMNGKHVRFGRRARKVNYQCLILSVAATSHDRFRGTSSIYIQSKLEKRHSMISSLYHTILHATISYHIYIFFW